MSSEGMSSMANCSCSYAETEMYGNGSPAAQKNQPHQSPRVAEDRRNTNAAGTWALIQLA